jgi:hypothetical protein
LRVQREGYSPSQDEAEEERFHALCRSGQRTQLQVAIGGAGSRA